MSLKIPGWGLCRIIDKRVKDGVEQGLIDSPGHEAPFWLDLKEVARYKGRVIYDDGLQDNEQPNA
jgi:hypothetical protein